MPRPVTVATGQVECHDQHPVVILDRGGDQTARGIFAIGLVLQKVIERLLQCACLEGVMFKCAQVGPLVEVELDREPER